MRAFSAVFLGLALLILTFIYAPSGSFAQTATSTSLENQINSQNQEINQLTQEIAQYQTEIQAADSNKKTLQNAINALNLQLSKVKAQASVTEHQIAITQLQIQQLGTVITTTQGAIQTDQDGVAEDLRSIEQTDNQPFVLQLFSSGGFIQAWDDADQILQVQAGIQNQVDALTAQKQTLTTSQVESKQQKNTLTSQEQALATQQKALASTAQSKSTLLTETSASEATYEKLLAQAQSELAGFSTFAQNAGGAGLLANQTSCDAWGCYYNQRDSAWGNDELDGTQYLLKSDGCLITAVAMVMTHYGYDDVTPVTINSNPANFAAYYPAYLLYTINVDGVSVTRKTAAIDATLATGNPVIVGIYAYGGTHFVVLTSGSKGHYLMRDPYIPNGEDISFTAHYSLKDIFGVSKVVITT